MIALDANTILRLVDNADPLYRISTSAVFKCRRADRVVLFPQAMFEFWAVATRPVIANGQGMHPERASRWISKFSSIFPVLADPPDLLERWHALVARHRVTGFRAHDARYVAAMECHGIATLLTYNQKHFKDYSITLLDPTTI